MTNQRSLSERPTTLKSFVAPDRIKEQIRKLVDESVRAILITGQTGTGKTTLADILAKVLSGKCKEDIVRLNFVTENGIDTVRNLIRKIEYLPSLKRRVFILEEFHAATKQAQEAFLDAIDHPPHDQITFIFTTNQKHKLLKTMLDRCSKIDLPSPSQETLIEYLKSLGYKDKVAKIAAENSGNSFRASLQAAQDMVNGGGSTNEFEKSDAGYVDKIKAWSILMAKPSFESCKSFMEVCENDFMAIRTFTTFTNDYIAYKVGKSTNPFMNGLFAKADSKLQDLPFSKLCALASRSTKVYDEAREHGEVFSNRFISIFARDA